MKRFIIRWIIELGMLTILIIFLQMIPTDSTILFIAIVLAQLLTTLVACFIFSHEERLLTKHLEAVEALSPYSIVIASGAIIKYIPYLNAVDKESIKLVPGSAAKHYSVNKKYYMPVDIFNRLVERAVKHGYNA